MVMMMVVIGENQWIDSCNVERNKSINIVIGMDDGSSSSILYLVKVVGGVVVCVLNSKRF